MTIDPNITSTLIRNAGGALADRTSRRPSDARSYGRLGGDQLESWMPKRGRGESEEDAVLKLADSMYEESELNHDIPAGYTFFGQFIAHDLTFAVHPFPPDRERRFFGRNRRSPRFDLDSVYAGGPTVAPHLYELADPRKLLIGRNRLGELDLPRNLDTSADGSTDFNRRRTALVGDLRNDDNTITAQLHLAILRFHNRVVEELGLSFEEARVLTTLSYQCAVRDYLRRVCGRQAVEDAVHGVNSAPFAPFAKAGTLPLEFSFAAFRFGHSMVGSTYHLNNWLDATEGRPLNLLLDTSPGWRERNGHAHRTLEGQRELPPAWTVQWDRFVSWNGSLVTQPSRAIDTRLSPALRTLPIHAEAGDPDERTRSLAYRTLWSGFQRQLPTGRSLAKEFKIGSPVRANYPLFIHILHEAENDGGRRLGPLGAWIVSNVFLGALRYDECSIMREEGGIDWQPWSDLGIESNAEFELKDFLAFSGAPMTFRDWRDQVPESARQRDV